FGPHPGPPCGEPVYPADVELARVALAKTEIDRDTRLAQALASLRRGPVGIARGGDDAGHARGEQRLGTRRRSAMVVAGLQGHVRRGPVGRLAAGARGLEGDDFGVRLAGPLVPALADNAPVAHDDAADARIGSGGK